MKTLRKCKLCKKPGHRSDKCPDNPANGKAKPPRAAAPALVSADDLPSIKAAAIAVVDALEAVDPKHRARVIESAQLILGGA